MNNRIITKAAFAGVVGWLAVAGLSIVVLRRSPAPAPSVAEPQLQLAQGVFERPQGDRNRPKNPGTVPDEDWNAAKDFLKAHAPNRYGQIDRIPSGEAREGLKRFLINYWHGVVEIQTKSPDLYATRVREIELGDDVFGICLRLRRNKTDPKQLEDLNSKITDLFDLGLTEREQRIALVEQSLEDQKKALESDKLDKVKLAQQKYDYVLAHGVEGASLDSTSPRRPGPRGRPGSSTSPSPSDSVPDSSGAVVP